MKVGLASNWDIQCGNAQYARDLQRELEREFTVVGLPSNLAQARRDIIQDDDIKVVIVNWHSSRVTVTPEDFAWLRTAKVKSVLIHQNWDGDNNVPQLAPDVMVIHEDFKLILTDKREPWNIVFIPHGIPIVETNRIHYRKDIIGTAGFPFPWKRFDVVAEAAKRFNLTCRMYAPKSDQMDTDVFMDGIAGHLGNLAAIKRHWASVEEVVSGLAECVANIFWFESQDPCDQLGQSGSVRLGIAAQRPTIISTHRKLRTLFKYAEESLYVCEKEKDVYDALENILFAPALAKLPTEVLEEQSWQASGLKYRRLVKELAQ